MWMCECRHAVMILIRFKCMDCERNITYSFSPARLASPGM